MDRRAGVAARVADQPVPAAGRGPSGPPPVGLVHPRVVRRLLVTLVAVLALLSAVGMLALRPSGQPAPGQELATGAGSVVALHQATVLSVRESPCRGDGAASDAALQTSCPVAEVRLEEGPEAGVRTQVPVPPQVVRGGLDPGTRVELGRYAEDPATGTGATYAWEDFSRTLPLSLVVLAFAVVTLAVGRWKGLAALGGLVVAYLVIIGFVVPALLEGRSPVLVTLCAATATMTVVLYLTHGFSLKTTTALLGTVLGLALTAAMAVGAVEAAQLRGVGEEEAYRLAQLTGAPDLSALVVAGMIIAGLGVLNDVTIAQASGVWEFREHDPTAGFWPLFRSGMRMGRDHLASTIYTIAFAYAGASLPTLVVIHLYQQPLGQVVTSSSIAEEVVGTAVAAIGLVAAIPFTTAVAAAAVARAGVAPRSGRRAAGRSELSGHRH